MKKVALALALASLFGIAKADGVAQIYGVIDASVVQQTSSSGLKTDNLNSMTTQSSILGFRGKDAIDSKNSIGFNLETGLYLNNGNVGSGVGAAGGTSAQTGYVASAGTSTLFNRQANIEASTELGSLKIGRQYTPFFLGLLHSDALGTASGGIGMVQANLAGGGRLGNGMLTGVAGPMNPDTNSQTPAGNFGGAFTNGISYVSPAIAGLRATGMVGFNQSSSALGNNYWNTQSQQDIGIMYDVGPISAQYQYQTINDNTGQRLMNNSLADVILTIDKLSLSASYYDAKFGVCSQAAGNCMTGALSISSAGVATGATYAAVGTAYGDDLKSGALGASYQATPKSRVALEVTGIHDTVNTANKVTMTTAFADYKFTKRSSMYVMATHAANEGNAAFSPVFGMPATTGSGSQLNMVALGLKTSF